MRVLAQELLLGLILPLSELLLLPSHSWLHIPDPDDSNFKVLTDTQGRCQLTALATPRLTILNGPVIGIAAPPRSEGDQGRIETGYQRLCQPICDLLVEMGGNASVGEIDGAF